MDLKEAMERNLVFRTEYGAGARVLGGLFKRRAFRRRSYRPGGETGDDVIHERTFNLGLVKVTHRSRNPGMFSGDDYLLNVSLLGLFVVSNEKDFLLALKGGPSVRVLKLLLAATPAGLATEAVDLDVAARAGVRLNVTRLIRDLQSKNDDFDPEADDNIDLD